MNKLLFGTAGIPLSTKLRTTQAGIERVQELELGCMEIQFVRGVKMGTESAVLVSRTAEEKNVILSVHAPYFINLNAREQETIDDSCHRLLHSARIASICGARNVVFHPAYYMGRSSSDTYATVKGHLKRVVETLRNKGNQVLLSPEVMGKVSEFGTLEEILNLSAEIEGVTPCLDFAHWHARTGRANSYPEFVAILNLVEQKLGKEALEQMHIHLSGIAYGEKGEIKHLKLADSDFQYLELLTVLREREAGGTIICESPNREEDALLLQRAYHELP